MGKFFLSISLALASLAWRAHAEEFRVPTLTGPVVDQAGYLQPQDRQTMERILYALYHSGGSQLVVLTLPDLGGLTIEEAGIKVVDAWQLGDKTKDNGVLLLVAAKERSVRIEVGQGLEGELPDAWAKRIIDEVILPLFKAGDFSSGIVAGVAAIAERTDPDFQLQDLPRAQAPPQGRHHGPPSLLQTILFFLAFAFLIFTKPGRMLLWFMLLSGLGGGRGGHRGGGGFGGGGGGFSGGGASGRW